MIRSRRSVRQQHAAPATAAQDASRPRRLGGSAAGVAGVVVVLGMLLLCLGALPYTLATPEGSSVPRYDAGETRLARIAPLWWPQHEEAILRLHESVDPAVVERLAASHGATPAEALSAARGPLAEALSAHHPRWLLGTDMLGRSVLLRALTGGGVSLGVGLAAAGISVFIGTLYGAVSGYAGGRADALLMRAVDVLYGLPYVLLVVLIAVAADGVLSDLEARGVELSGRERAALDLVVLLVAIGGVSWLTMARVVRGQVLSLKSRPFVEAARAAGAGPAWVFTRHLLPNLAGPIAVYATLTVPQAILQESFLSFLGIGVKPPLPSWGNLAAEGLDQLNTYRSHWWFLAVPCVLLAVTLLALNFVGESLREALDPRRGAR